MIRATKSPVLAFGLAVLASLLGAPMSDAQACGGVFVQQVERPGSRSIVRDHRMAIAIGKTKTVIWDEVRLEGDPQDFAWITPVKQGTKIELADDEWLSALDVSTQPVVYGPRYDSRGGCALAGCASDQETESAAPSGSVFIVREEVLGPYESVTVRAAGDPDAPYRWLVANGYKIDDDNVRSMLASYAQQGFDFAALKLRPTCGQTSMQPVRIVIPGSDPRILVRMALAGARADAVPITLFVLGEAPYRPSSYPFGFFDDDRLEWDRDRRSSSSSSSSSSSPYYAPRSNYDAIANDVMAQGGRTWLVEAVMLAELTAGTTHKLPTPGLFEAYDALCAGTRPRNAGERSGRDPTSTTTANPSVGSPCPTVTDAGADAAKDAGDAGDGGDGGSSIDAGDASSDASTDAATDDAGDGGDAGEDDDAGDDAGGTSTIDAGISVPRCLPEAQRDFRLAINEVVGSSRVFVTRLRARIQPNALASELDLVRATTPDDRLISNLHQVARYEDEDERPNKRACSTSKIVKHERRAPAGTWALGAAAALVLTAWLRRKKR